jgi:hypothetical protein
VPQHVERRQRSGAVEGRLRRVVDEARSLGEHAADRADVLRGDRSVETPCMRRGRIWPDPAGGCRGQRVEAHERLLLALRLEDLEVREEAVGSELPDRRLRAIEGSSAADPIRARIRRTETRSRRRTAPTPLRRAA